MDFFHLHKPGIVFINIYYIWKFNLTGKIQYLYPFTMHVATRTLFKNLTRALCFKIHTKTQLLFKTLECLRLLCHRTCFGHILDHQSGDVPCTMLLSALLLHHYFTWVCGLFFCLCCCHVYLSALHNKTNSREVHMTTTQDKTRVIVV